MRFVIFTHSLVSDWNHGNAHFLRGVATELVSRGHEIRIFEPSDSWSRNNLVAQFGEGPIRAFHNAYPLIHSIVYDPDSLDLNAALCGADVVIVHEWNPQSLVARIGEHAAEHESYKLFFHDTHHRCVTSPASMKDYDLRHYDGALVYGESIRSVYLKNGWARDAWTWHEAADTRVFRPLNRPKTWDLVWVGNWGDDERAEEIREFLIAPVKALGLKALVYGVRYPAEALEEMYEAGIEYRGWLPNFQVPEVFAESRATVHIPRRPYVEALPGIPTIRPFEALACGIPLISSPWDDREQLFRAGLDFLFAADSCEMIRQLRAVLSDRELSQSLTENGLESIRERHTCEHRVNQLIEICAETSEQFSVAGRA